MNNKKLFVISSAALFAAVALLASSGVSVRAAPAAAETPDPEKGVVLIAVDADGPAAQAGVVRGDILQQVDGQPVDTIVELYGLLEDLEPDDDVEVVVLHGDEIRTLTVTLGERDGRAILGVSPSATGLEQVAFTVVEEDGVVISEVLPGSPAEKAGIGAGDVILSINGEVIASGGDLVEAVASSNPGDVIVVEADTGDEDGIVEMEIMLSEHPDDSDMGYLGVRFSRVPRVFTHDLDLEGLPFHHFEDVVPEEFDFVPFEPHFIPHGESLKGALVTRVAEDSPAAEAGLKPSEFIESVNGEALSDMEGLRTVLSQYQPGDEVTLTLRRPVDSDEEDLRTVNVILGEHPDDADLAYLGVSVAGVSFGQYEGDLENRKGSWLWRQFQRDLDSRVPRPMQRRFRWLPDWDLDLELPFDLDGLRDRFGEMQLFRFDRTPGQEAGAEASGQASASA